MVYDGPPSSARCGGIVALFLLFSSLICTSMIHCLRFPSTAFSLSGSASFNVQNVNLLGLKLPLLNKLLSRPSGTAAGYKSDGSRQECAEDILLYLGPRHQRAVLSDDRLEQLRRCIRPIVGRSSYSRNYMKRLIQIGSRDVLRLAAVASSYGPEAVLQELAYDKIEIPDVDGSRAAHCQLGKFPYGRRFRSKRVNQYFALLFSAAAAFGPNVSLTRFDLFHAHLFISKRTRRLGALFHAREYPAYNPPTFPVNLGYCQTGRALCLVCGDKHRPTMIKNGTKATRVTKRGWNGRRWIERVVPGVFCILDASPGTVVYEELVQEGLEDFRTVYEGDFGDVIGDVNYFISDVKELPEDRIYFC